MSGIEQPQEQGFIHRFERQLISARRPRRIRLRRPAILGACGVVLVAGTAVAAIAPWTPDLGPGHPREFKIVDSPVPQSQLDVLAVLRRDQTSTDRGPDATYALRFFGRNVGGVRTDGVRVLRGSKGANAAVLVPVSTYRPTGSGQTGVERDKPATERDGLCLFVRDITDGGAQRCYSVDAVRAGKASGAVADGRGLLIYGLVPDGVTSVRIQPAQGAPISVAINDSFYEYQLSAGANGAVSFKGVQWLDDAGQVTRSQEGMTVFPPGPATKWYDCDPGARTAIVVPEMPGIDPKQACRQARARGTSSQR
jgi:hypothetical protein